MSAAVFAANAWYVASGVVAATVAGLALAVAFFITVRLGQIIVEKP